MVPMKVHPSDCHAQAETAGAQVWVISSYRAGENSQLRGLVQGLEARLSLSARWLRPRYTSDAGLLGLMRAVSARGVGRGTACIAQPWPTLIVSAGLKNEPLARWIKRASGGRSRIIFLGRTWAPVKHFDLVITTPQYRLADAANVLQNRLTLHDITAERLSAAKADWAPVFERLTSPRTALLLGGSSGDFTLDPTSMTALCEQLSTRRTVLATSSARTPSQAFDVLTRFAQTAGPRWFTHRWQTGLDAAANPYLGILAWADEIVVTADSVAMLSEALATGKPVAVFDPRSVTTSAAAKLYRFGMRYAPRRLTRDVDIVLEAAYASGQVRPLGAPLDQYRARPSDLDLDLDAAIERMRGLL